MKKKFGLIGVLKFRHKKLCDSLSVPTLSVFSKRYRVFTG